MDLIIKGFIIGIGKILPGISGAMLALTLGVYDEIIESISNIKIKKIPFITKIGIGIILSISLMSKVVVKCLNKYYLPTMLLFIGIIIGGIPKFTKQIKIKTKDIIPVIIILITLILLIKKINIINTHKIEYNTLEILKLIGVGLIDALSSIIPGLSGTALLMMIGYYDIILNTFATLLNIDYINQNIFVILPFSIGFILGIIIISKIINILFQKEKNKMNILILLFMVITTISLLNKTLTYKTSKIQLIIGITLFIIGLISSIYIEKKT